MSTEAAQEKRYWTHDEIGSEAGRLCEASVALQQAVDAIAALPSRGNDLVGEASVSEDDLAALRGVLWRVDSACGHATDSAAQSYADECEEQAPLSRPSGKSGERSSHACLRVHLAPTDVAGWSR